MRNVRTGFTLLEVNLAIMVMAMGILGMCALYLFGYRESRQSVEDVAGVACADVYLAPLVQGLSSTEMKWSNWCRVGKDQDSDDEDEGLCAVAPTDGWAAYAGKGTGLDDAGEYSYVVFAGSSATADRTYREVAALLPGEHTQSAPPDVDCRNYALVVTRDGAKIQLAFRAADRCDFLMSQPMIVTEVHFQGDPNQ